MSDRMLEISVEDGKYSVFQESDGRLHALRHGEPWARDIVGDKLVLALAQEVARLRAGGSQALRDIAAERARHPSADVDDYYMSGELAEAGASYALHAYETLKPLHQRASSPPATWPWSRSKWSPKDVRSTLVRAGALIAAEIEAYDRRKEATK